MVTSRCKKKKVFVTFERTKTRVLELVLVAMLAMLADSDNAILLVQPHRVADYR